MQVIQERCCGMDVHKKTVVACVLTPEGKQVRTFGTMTGQLWDLVDWLDERQVSHVAMESTGVYWKPIYNLLEGLDLTVLIVNAQHIKAMPGRKTDVKDSEWIADLLRHGLVRGSYIPDRPQRELRELVRYRRSLMQQRAQVINRIGPSGVLGEALPRQLHQRREASCWQEWARQSIAAASIDGGGLGSIAHQEELPCRSVPTACRKTRRQTCRGCFSPFDPGDHLPHAETRHNLRGPGTELF